MGKSGISDGLFTAALHVQGVNARQMGESGISDGLLIALAHVQGVNARQMSKSGISDGLLIAAIYACARCECPPNGQKRHR